jgi:hypothetical protein
MYNILTQSKSDGELGETSKVRKLQSYDMEELGLKKLEL